MSRAWKGHEATGVIYAPCALDKGREFGSKNAERALCVGCQMRVIGQVVISNMGREPFPSFARM